MTLSPMALPSQHVSVLHGLKDIRLEHRTICPPQDNQAQVAVRSTGLCGSDLHYYMHGRNGAFTLQAPLILGHEAAGIVTAIGPGVKNLVPGQRVAIEAGIMCNHCDYCTKGRYNLCKELQFCSSAKTSPHTDGTLQDCMNHPSHLLHPIPDSCTFEQAALAEPLSVVVHAARRSGLSAGQTVLVFGAGTIGLLVCAVAKSMGASLVVAIDANQTRLDFARSNGFASQVFCLPTLDHAKTTAEQLQRAKEFSQSALAVFDKPEGFDLVYECTGAEPCIQMSIHTAIAGGRVMLIGMGSDNIMLPLSAAALREVDIQGCFRYANTYPTALTLLASGKLDNVDKLVTHRFSLGETANAFELLARGNDGEGRMVLKVMIGPS